MAQNKLNVDLIYPIGSIYMSVNGTNPSTLFGGTWEQLKDRFLLGSGDTYTNGTTGGEATHKLTINEMPSHNHDAGNGVVSESGSIYSASIRNDGGAFKYMVPIGNRGGNQAHNNMPPYLVVYMWKRIS